MVGDQSLQVSSIPPTRERVGLIVDGSNAAVAVITIARSRSCRSATDMDGSTTCLARCIDDVCSCAATRTPTVRLGTSITPTYPRHPLVLAQQVLALYDLAPGRLRLGIGPSHRFIIEDIYGLQQRTPLAHLREYLEVLLRTLGGPLNVCTLGRFRYLFQR